MTTDITTATPVEIDTVLAANYNEQAKYWGHVESYVRHIERARNSKYGTLAEIDKLTATLDGYRAKLAELRSEAAPYQVEYNRRPWNRYFLVNNVGGHVHRGMNCTTCFPTTEYNWLVDLADCDEDAMIEEWGEMACTVCFPSAPSNPNYNRPSRRDREAQAVREAEKAEREAKKAEKNLRPEEQFKDHDGRRVTTVAGAKQAIRDEVEFHYYGAGDGSDPHPWWVESIKAAKQAREVLLARGVSAAELDKIVTNATKKAMKTWSTGGPS
jgi:hypothetical protein